MKNKIWSSVNNDTKKVPSKKKENKPYWKSIADLVVVVKKEELS